MRSRFSIRLAAVLLALILSMPLAAAGGEEYPFAGFAAADVRMRKSPSDTAQVLLTIPAGESVLVTGQSGIYYIAAYLGTQGYVMKKYVSLAPGAAISVIPSAETEEDAASGYHLLYSGMSGDAVSALQDALKELGFYTGTVDGKFGSGTKNAVSAFQAKNGLTKTGTADAAMQKLIFAGKPKNSKGTAVTVKTVPAVEDAVIASGSRGEAVKKLQTRLKELGYYTGSVDGVCGSGTVSAIKAFQKKMGLTQTGKADAALRALLNSVGALSAKATATPKPTAAPQITPEPFPSVPSSSAVYPYTTYTLSSVNLRKAASVSSTRLATVSKGAEIKVLATEGTFLKAQYNGKTGYVMAEYVNIPVQYLPGTVLSTDQAAQQTYASLQYGATGSNVKALKEALKELGFYTGIADSIFDVSTTSALKAFQNKNGLRQDGVASPELQKLIFEGKPKNSKGTKTDVKTLPPIQGWEMRLNDRGDAVTALQDTLREMGLFTGTSTGIFNSATDKAVRAFQKAHNLTVDGVVGKKTYTLLSLLMQPTQAPAFTQESVQPTVQPFVLTAANVVVMRSGTKGTEVKRLQQKLQELGYYTGTADGVVGKATMAAVKEFQQKNNLQPDGIAGLDTQLRLYSASALPKATAVPGTAPGAVITNAPAATPNTAVTLRIGSNGENVRLLQERLTVLKYYSSAVDGIFGTGTAQAVTLFQKTNGLTADGVAGKNTLTKLYSSSAASYYQPQATAAPAAEEIKATLLRSGDTGTEVKKMQKRLVELGYLTAADGIYGTQTYQAVKAFQKRNGLTSDGIAGKMTLNRLYSASAVAAVGSADGTPVVVPSVNPGASSSSSFKAPSASEVRNANWYSEIRDRARLMPDLVIYDPDTGLHYNLHMFSFGKHADAEPPTAADTAVMNQVIGENSWTPKYVWAIFSDGRVYIASTHSHGHEVDHTSGNDLTGHVCIHFPRVMSEAEATGPYAVSHQKEILFGWEATQAMAK